VVSRVTSALLASGVQMNMLSFLPVAVTVALVGWVIIYVSALLMLRGESSSEGSTMDWRVEIRVEPIAATASILPPIGVGLAAEMAMILVVLLAVIGTCVSLNHTT
jgi:hypothetical protein